MPNGVSRKGTILIPSGPTADPDRKHLFVVCTDPCENNQQVLVPISSVRSRLCDQTCLLQPHEHPFLRRESFVFYRQTRIEAHQVLLDGVAQSLFEPRDDMNGQTFLRVFNGICRSSQTPRRVKRYLGCD